MATRKRYDNRLKAQIALEAIKDQRTISEIASDYGIHPNQVGQWKKKLLEELPDIFSGKGEKKQDNEAIQNELYRQIGQLKVELDCLCFGYRVARELKKSWNCRLRRSDF